MHSDEADELLYEVSTHVQYQKIKTIEQQRHDVDPCSLRSLAEPFLHDNEHQYFGICLLHRHQNPPPHYVMVHSYTQTGKDMCDMELLGSRPQYPCAFYFAPHNQVLSYEYTSIPRRLPGKAFLAALSSLLRGCGLQEVLALCCITPSERPWVEIPQAAGQSTIAVQPKTEAEFAEVDGVVTEWAFIWDGEKIEIREQKKCIEPTGGGHKFIEDSSSCPDW